MYNALPLVALLLRTVSSAAASSCQAIAKPFPFTGYPNAGLLPVYGNLDSIPGFSTDPASGVVEIHGVGQVHLVQDFRRTTWDQHKYVRIDLRQQELRFTVDLSAVQCRCAATLYLSFMPDPNCTAGSNYCGINSAAGSALAGADTCVEVDLMEANVKAFQTTVHTQRGTHFDGTCNQKGCLVNWGNETHTATNRPTASLYGLAGGLVDTKQPFNVSARMDSDANLVVSLSQGAVTLQHYNRSFASNPNANVPNFPHPTGVSNKALNRTALAMRGGMALVLSMWGGFEKLDGWLNGQCDASGGLYPPCTYGDPSSPSYKGNQTMKIWNLELVEQ